MWLVRKWRAGAHSVPSSQRATLALEGSGMGLPQGKSYNETVWHCHILEHEEHDMMRPLVIVGENPQLAPPKKGGSRRRKK